MNQSLQIQSTETPLECLVGEVPAHLSTHAYSMLVFDIIILAVTCPFTVMLNVLTIIAVKIKARLQSMSNIVLACLATTDVMVGVLVKPPFIAVLITRLQDQATIHVCRLQTVTRYAINFFCFSSLAHLVLMSADRYMAIKQSYTYEQTVTKTRVLMASAIAWFLSTAVLIFHFFDRNVFMSVQNSFGVVFMVLIAICSVVVYYEARRHEREIALQQVSVEARERFLRERKALKLTTTVVVIVFVSYLPIISSRVIKKILKDIVSPDMTYAFHLSASSLVLLNSFINPLVYSVRLRQFRVAFIEMLLKKNRAEAAEFEKKMFGSRNAALNDVTNQGGEEDEQNGNQVNVIIYTEANEEGETEEQNSNQVNANIDIETNQGGETEEQNVNQLNATIDIETNQGGETEEKNVNQENANIASETNEEEMRTKYEKLKKTAGL